MENMDVDGVDSILLVLFSNFLFKIEDK